MASTALTFEEGNFAGKKVRVTDDRQFVSALDVIAVVGVGRNSTQVWAEVDKEVLQMYYQTDNTSSDHGKVIFKDHKFPGQGKETFIFYQVHLYIDMNRFQVSATRQSSMRQDW